MFGPPHCKKACVSTVTVYSKQLITYVHSVQYIRERVHRQYDMTGRSQMQGGKDWILPKEMNANRIFGDSHWLEIWKNHLYHSMGLNGGSVAMDSG